MCGVYRSGGSGYGGPAANEKFYDPERVILSIKIPDNIILCTNIARFSQSYDKEQTQNIDACLCAKRQRFWLVKTLMWTIIDPYATYLCNIWILQTKNYTSAIRFKNPERVLPDIRAEPENWCHQQTASCSCQWTLSYKHAVEKTAKLQYQWNIAALREYFCPSITAFRFFIRVSKMLKIFKMCWNLYF